MLQAVRDPLGRSLELARRYGDTLTLPTLQGPLVLTSDPEAIKTLFTAPPEALGPSAFDGLRDLFSGQSLLLMGGAEHRTARRLLGPPFHGPRMRAYGPLIQAAAQRHLRAWPTGRRFALQQKMQDISLDVIIGSLFGVTDDAGVQRFRDALLAWFAALNQAGLAVLFRALRRPFGGLGPWAAYLRRRDQLFGLLQALIDTRRQGAPGDDILSLLLAARTEDGPLADVDIMGHLITLTVAGMETTAILLSWAAYGLLRHPAALARLRAELAAAASTAGPTDPEALARLPYLDAVLNETLRRWPGTIAVTRRLHQPLRVAGHDLPAGTLVGASTLVHFRPDLYPDPLAFSPERFLTLTPTPFTFLPFGGGARRCIGAALATLEAKLVLAEVVAAPLRLAADRPLRPVLRALALGPAGGVPVVLDPTSSPLTQS